MILTKRAEITVKDESTSVRYKETRFDIIHLHMPWEHLKE